jgi:GntR family transcriptional regulator
VPSRVALASPINQRLPTPLYHQIYLILRGQILEGALPEGAWLPGEPDLARQFNVSRITARRALAELAAEGLVTRGRGRGTRVSGACPPVSVHGGIEGLIENLITMGLKTRVMLVDFAYEAASPHVAAALRIKPGDEVQRSIRVRSIAEGPFSHLTTFVPAAIGRKFSRRDLAREPLLALLERAGIVIGSAEQTISASLADTRVAPLLETAVGSPLSRISRIVYDASETPVEFIVGLYRPDRYQFRMSLDRVRGESCDTWSAKASPSQQRAAPSAQSNRRERAR